MIRKNIKFTKELYAPQDIEASRHKILLELGKKLNAARINKNDSQLNCATAVGVSKSMISRYENGECEIPASIIPILAARYDTKIQNLYGTCTERGAMSGFKNLDFLVTSIATEKQGMDGYQNAALIANYFATYYSCNEANSFDKLYLISELSNKLNTLLFHLEQDDLSENIQQIINDFIKKIELMSQNDYKENHSIFYDEIVNRISINENGQIYLK